MLSSASAVIDLAAVVHQNGDLLFTFVHRSGEQPFCRLPLWQAEVEGDSER